MRPISIISVFVLCCLSGCKSSLADECKEQPKENCICTMHYDPVCGCNNKTYGNSCDAECNGITSYTKGACDTN